MKEVQPDANSPTGFSVHDVDVFDPAAEQLAITQAKANVDLRKTQAMDTLTTQFQAEYDALDARQAILDSATQQFPEMATKLNVQAEPPLTVTQ